MEALSRSINSRTKIRPNDLHRFQRRVPLKDVAAGIQCAPSRITSSQGKGSGGQAISDNETFDSHTHNFNHFLSPIPCISHLPTPKSWLPHCIRNWHCITTDYWVLQVVSGYMQARTDVTSSSEVTTFGLRAGKARGDSETTEKKSNKGGSQLPRPISQPVLKKDGSSRPVATESVMERSHSITESLGMIRDLLKNNNWMASIDLKDAYFLEANSGRVTRLPMAGQSVRVSVPSFWPDQCTPCLDQATESSVDASVLSKNMTYNVPG